MTRLTDKHIAAELKHNCDGLRAAGIDPPMSDLRYIRLAEYEDIEEMTERSEPKPLQWISVKDKLPDENQKCLVYRDIDNDLKITTGIWHSDRKTFDGLRHGTRLKNTIAWMPLPEPPKDGDSE